MREILIDSWHAVLVFLSLGSSLESVSIRIGASFEVGSGIIPFFCVFFGISFFCWI